MPPQPMRKPFVSPTASASGGGAPLPGMGMPPTPNGAGPQPTMPMGGSPGAAAAAPGGAGGGPTSPLNIGAMLQTQQPPQTMGATAQPAPMTVGSPLPPWGDQGTGSPMNPNQNAPGMGAGGMGGGPKRVPVDMSMGGSGGAQDLGMGDLMGAGGGGGGADMPQPGGDAMGGPTVMMRLLRSLGRI